eukprot:TRINITY_DN3326_c0_g1_i7.p1 TRINITY_DN3326_c0_g1~~TRINITY_DN3326_c0_g1_i7.p1  ORF type:complete len:207 (-),score=60.10 TRINITY_DN3326_c0_g1_i7:169-789(-)
MSTARNSNPPESVPTLADKCKNSAKELGEKFEWKAHDSDFYYRRSKELRKKLKQIKQSQSKKQVKEYKKAVECDENVRSGCVAKKEKLAEYKDIIMEKIRSLKNSNKAKNDCASLKSSKQNLGIKKANHDTVKASFHSIIDELNSKLSKYKKAVLSYEAKTHKQSMSPFYSSNTISESEYGIRGSGESRTHRKNFSKAMNRYTVFT